MEPADPDFADPRRRAGSDRRRRPTARLSRYSFVGGRRRRPRRAGEVAGAFVDLYDPRLLGCIVWIGLMNALDCFFTLFHLQAGGVELNPVAEMLLGSGRVGFVLLKSVVISLALLVLCVHHHFRLARVGLWVAASAYTLLVAYHLALLGA
ncbi:MAG: DUF5658 family protein [Planctomycetota bacterium]|jgi:hypothetical protein|nr:DUF5658 family protein [Planctomycetota bacterium]MDP6761432.1 DUF5658 family protein [Planctomycetota bacterium]MDP6990910.1 DUF5658 family protein [Planctomycetota bacterium]